MQCIKETNHHDKVKLPDKNQGGGVEQMKLMMIRSSWTCKLKKDEVQLRLVNVDS